jgi:hypothetical protein
MSWQISLNINRFLYPPDYCQWIVGIAQPLLSLSCSIIGRSKEIMTIMYHCLLDRDLSSDQLRETGEPGQVKHFSWFNA